MDGLLLDCFNLKRIQLHVKYLTKIHHYRLVYLLPQVSAENLDQRDLQCWDLAMHEDTS